VTFHAPLGNEGVVVVGGVDLALTPEINGVELGGGDSYTYAISNAALLRHASNDVGQLLNVEVKKL
jgi:2C-methyl-D-erythritol 2,4-cyclodiphosphate synthase